MSVRLLVFGGSGAIGSAVKEGARSQGWQVTTTQRTPSVDANDASTLVVDPFGVGMGALDECPSSFDAVCWAQGANLNDSVFDFDEDAHMELYRANVLFVLITLRTLIDKQLLARGARLCVVSSIWQELARQRKLSYSITKAAVAGLVRSLSVDLAEAGCLVNAVLPGVLDTPMTRRNLSASQLERIRSATKFDALPSLDGVTAAVLFLLSADNVNVTGVSVPVDLGFSHVRLL